MTDEKLDPLLQRIEQELKSGNDGLDGHVLSRLNQARQKALAQQSQPWWKGLFSSSGFVPAGTLAAVALAALLFFQQTPQVDVPEAVDDFEVLLAEENLDLYEELEFYVWLDELEEANAG
ncbi:MAG: hypothetical protein AAF438_16250 [Pseudomonadota bacterium]